MSETLESWGQGAEPLMLPLAPPRSVTAAGSAAAKRAGQPRTAAPGSQVAWLGCTGSWEGKGAHPLPLLCRVPDSVTSDPSLSLSSVTFLPACCPAHFHTCPHPTATRSLTTGLPLSLLLLLILVLLGAIYWHRARLRQRLCQLKGPSCQYRYQPPCCQLPPQR